MKNSRPVRIHVQGVQFPYLSTGASEPNEYGQCHGVSDHGSLRKTHHRNGVESVGGYSYGFLHLVRSIISRQKIIRRKMDASTRRRSNDWADMLDWDQSTCAALFLRIHPAIGSRDVYAADLGNIVCADFGDDTSGWFKMSFGHACTIRENRDKRQASFAKIAIEKIAIVAMISS